MQKKKLLGSALTLAMLLPYGPAQAADLLKNLKVDGSIDLQATSANNVSDFKTSTYDQLGDAQARIMVNTGFDLLDDVHSMVTFRKNDYAWGSGASNVASNQQNNIPGSASQGLMGAGAGVLNNIFLDQAYFKVDKVFGAIDATLGRQFYGNQGDMIIYFGPYSNLYGLGVSAIDAARFDWSNDMIGVTGLAGKFKGIGFGANVSGVPANTVNTESTGIDVTGLNATVKGNEMWNAGAYVWQRLTHNIANGANPGTALGNDNLWVVGAKGKVSAGPAWAKVEVAKNFGTNRTVGAVNPSQNYDGWAVKLDLGAKADVGMATLSPWGQFADASGGNHDNKNWNFTAINPDYRPGGIYGYFSSISADALGNASGPGTVTSNALSNRVVWGLGLNATPAAASKLTTGLSYWDYHFQSQTGLVAASVGNKHIGSELDLNLGWKHSDNVAFNVAWGQFWTGGAINNAQADHRPVSLYQFNTSVKF